MNCIGLVYLIRGLQRRRELQQQQLQESADADVEGGEEVSDDDDDDDNADDVGCFVVFAVSVAITSAVLLFAVVAYIISQDTRCPYVTA